MNNRNRKSTTAIRQARSSRSPVAAIGVVAVVVFAAIVGIVMYNADKDSDATVPPGAIEDGIVVGRADAPVTVDLYLDFQCPVCARYEAATGSTIDQLVEAGTAKVVYHPVAYLDRASSSRYSSRSSAAAGCVAATPGAFPRFLTSLLERQPPEGGPGLSDDTLITVARQAGATGDIEQCIRSERYSGWTANLTEEASKAGVTGTPTVLVDGKRISNDPQALQQAVSSSG